VQFLAIKILQDTAFWFLQLQTRVRQGSWPYIPITTAISIPGAVDSVVNNEFAPREFDFTALQLGN
jgi:hypothetical protein